MIQLIVVRLRLEVMVSHISVLVADEHMALSVETPCAPRSHLLEGTRLLVLCCCRGGWYILVDLAAEALYCQPFFLETERRRAVPIHYAKQILSIVQIAV